MVYDEVPGACSEIGTRRERSFPAGFQVSGAPVRKAGAFFLLQGGMGQYALIGGQFAPAPEDSLTVQVGLSPSAVREKAFRSGLRKSVFAGLPEYLAEYVLYGIADYERRHVLPGGVLTIDRAANSELDSSPSAFRHATSWLVAVITAAVRGEDVDQALRWRALSS